MADVLYVLFRLLHVGSAVFFIGGATMWGAIVAPTLQSMGSTLPKGVMPTLGKRIVTILPHMGVLTLLSGLALFWSLGGFGPAGGTPWGIMISVSLLLLLAMLIISFAVLKPTFRKIGQLMMAAQGPPPPEAHAEMAKMTKFSMFNLALGWIAVLLMVLATARVG